MRNAMRAREYEAKTFVYDVYRIHELGDFDYTLADSFPGPSSRTFLGRALRAVLGPYAVFGWSLSRFDVFHFFFDGGFLAQTPLRFLEVQLLHLAGKNVVVMPYGSDVAVPSRIRSLPWRQALLASYPHLGRNEARTIRWINYFSKRADFIVGCVFHIETIPRWDLLTIHYYPIDTDAWEPDVTASLTDGNDDRTVTVIHAPNHRGLKGTEFLVSACRELEQEGLPIRLELLENVPNADVKRIMGDADIVAEQFLHGYALTAMEGMSLGKPVLSNLSDDAYYEVLRLYGGLDECPIVNTPVRELKHELRRLVLDPELRASLGRAGRTYVLRHHSYEAVGRMWELVYRQVWLGEKLEIRAWKPDGMREGSEPAPSDRVRAGVGSEGPA